MTSRYDAELELSDMARAVSRLLGEPLGTAVWQAIPVDIAEEGDALEITAYLPGVARESVEVELKNGVLSLRAERPLPEDNSAGRLLHVEAPYGRLERRIAVGREVGTNGAEATWRDGCLTVRLPKDERLRAQRIPVADAPERALPAPATEA
jgi:HSP20 family protein